MLLEHSKLLTLLDEMLKVEDPKLIIAVLLKHLEQQIEDKEHYKITLSKRLESFKEFRENKEEETT